LMRQRLPERTVSIPKWCDCKIEEEQRAQVTATFQFQNGAIASVLSSDMKPFAVMFQFQNGAIAS